MERLGRKEIEVLQMCSEGKSTKQIASSLFLTYETIKFHRKKIIEKMEAGNITQAVADGIREGIIK